MEGNDCDLIKVLSLHLPGDPEGNHEKPHLGILGFEFLTVRVLSFGIQRLVVRCKSTDVSEEHIASIFRVCFAYHLLVSCLAYSLIVKTICSSEKSIYFNRIHDVICQKMVNFTWDCRCPGRDSKQTPSNTSLKL
jgi:hypothetical protein